jgi:hypothetical protein
VGTVAAPITGLVRGLNSLIAGRAIQLQAIADQGLVSGEAPAPTAAEPEPVAAAEPEPEAPAEPEPVAAAEPEPVAAAEPEAEAAAEPEAEAAAEPEPEPEAEAEAAAAAEPDAEVPPADPIVDVEAEPGVSSEETESPDEEPGA